MSTNDFFRIRLSTIRPLEAIPFDIFIYIDSKMINYLKQGGIMKTEKVVSLHQKDTGESFYVGMKDKQLYRDYVKSSMNSVTISNNDKAAILRESSIALLEDLFENPDVGQALMDSKPIVSDLLKFMEIAPESISNLISLSGHDFYTYNHSFDVSIYSLGLGQALGFDKKTLEELGQSSLFHDVGKRNVSLDILCKKGPLDENEWAQMRMHPQFGLKILNEQPNISEAIRAACYEHHESWSGGGYPQDISGHEIHPFGRIVALTDTYDAMTTQRSYNVPMKPSEALTMMKEKLSGRFDPDMLKAMYSVLFKMKAAS
ncbi:MAG: HD domain-containing protein [Bdellovibrionaceae bacterium]|nr:HD domain-containing protein [Bdellovibrio sp.]